MNICRGITLLSLLSLMMKVSMKSSSSFLKKRGFNLKLIINIIVITKLYKYIKEKKGRTKRAFLFGGLTTNKGDGDTKVCKGRQFIVCFIWWSDY